MPLSSFEDYIASKQSQQPVIEEPQTEEKIERYDRFDFGSFIEKRNLDKEIERLSEALVEAHGSGVDVEPYLEKFDEYFGLMDEAMFQGARKGAGLGWQAGQMANNVLPAAMSVPGAIAGGAVDIGKAGATGVWNGLKQGATAGWRSLMGTDKNPSVAVADAIKLLQKASASSKNYGAEGNKTSQFISGITDQLSKQIQTLQNVEKQPQQTAGDRLAAQRQSQTTNWLDQRQRAPQLVTAKRLPQNQQPVAGQRQPTNGDDIYGVQGEEQPQQPTVKKPKPASNPFGSVSYST